MSKKNVKQKNKKRRIKISNIAFLIAILISFINIIIGGMLSIRLYALNILPTLLLIPVICIIVILSILLFLLLVFIAKKAFSKFLISLLVIVFTIVYGTLNYGVSSINQIFKQVTTLNTQMINTISLISTADSDISDIKDLNKLKVGISSSLDSQGTNKCLNELTKEASFSTEDFDNIFEMTDALYNGSVDAIIFNESYRGILYDTALEYEDDQLFAFNTNTKIIYQTVYYTKKTTDGSLSLKSVDVTKEPFTVLISGNDSYGGLNECSRSDANLLVTINPKEKTILMTSIPRDYYIPVYNSADNLDYGMDKLTHTGLYGIDVTEESIEQFLGVTINYHVRLNFSSLVNVVDALGGIDVYVEEGNEVDIFYANGLEGVSAGWNHLDGERALGFSRERKAYQDGDVQRVKNQQQVLQAIIKKATSLETFIHLDELIVAIGGAFETNMPSKDMEDFIRFEISQFPDWKFESYSLVGVPDIQYCSSLMSVASVVLPNFDAIKVAHNKVESVINGTSSNDVIDDIDETNYGLLTSNYYDDIENG